MKNVLFSFIFAWNGHAREISDAVQRLLKLDTGDIQIVCAARDGMEALAEDERIRYVKWELDLARTREICLEAAAGEYILFAGSCGIGKDALEKLRAAAKAAPDVIRFGNEISMSPGCIAVRRRFIAENGISTAEDIMGGAPVYVTECLAKCGDYARIDASPADIECGEFDVCRAARAWLKVQRIALKSKATAEIAAELCRRLGEGIYRRYSEMSDAEKRALDWSGLEAEKCAADILCEMYPQKLKTYVYNKIRPKYVKEIYELDAKVREKEGVLDALEGSLSYRVGRKLTRPFEKLFKKDRPARPEYSKLPEAPVRPYMRKGEDEWPEVIDGIIKRAGETADAADCACVEYDPATPFVSVVLPMYNVEKYVGQAYATLKAQTLKNFEMIFVDDGSTDRSPAMVEEFAREDPRVILLRQHNQHAGVARNNGLIHAKGKYVCFLDPDDFFEGRMLEKCYMAAEKHGADVTMFSADIYDQKERFLYGAYYLELAARMPSDRAFDGEEIIDSVFMLLNPWTKFYGRQFVMDQGIRYQPLYSSNDAHFTMMAMATARRICAVPDVLVHYRINRTGSLQDTKDKDPRNVFEAFNETRIRLEERGLYEKFAAPFWRKALESMLRSLESMRDFGATKGFYEFLKAEGMEKLGLTSCPAEVFRLPADRERYEKLRRIMNGSFEEYLFAERMDALAEVQRLRAKAAKK